MKIFLIIFAVVACHRQLRADDQHQLVEYPVDRSIVDIKNEFSRNNPFYKQRAGAFYEIKYVAPSAEALFRIANVRPEQMPGTLDALRAFVYDWLDAYVRGNGAIGSNELATCVARLDKRFDLLFDSALQRKLYRIWRDDEANKLRFLIKYRKGHHSATVKPLRTQDSAAGSVSNGKSSLSNQ
ncbi:hypothetical protein [Gimesia aquarii]|uniref:Uncharacterized protein n=1 Tax=Gimesia aquarii TaxID=2527964 RepID=A0A517X324_9PLAN|nr:hypothetical protein [Gimesia aquarii]QDU11911.1 hypothetical protein V202x_53360 [Gimesia aquarii]